jgi:hypothetical protein
MRGKFNTLPLLVLLGLGFLHFGSILPEPLGSYSTQGRNAVNQFIVGLFPDRQPRLRPNERTERQLKETEQRK